MRLSFLLLCAGLLLLAASISGCGLPGAPLPPSLHIPKPVEDLKAARKGNDVLLSWTAPNQSTDGTLVRKPGKMMISRSVGSDGNFATIAEMTLPPALDQDTHSNITVTDSLGSVLQSPAHPAFVTYRVVAVGERNRTAGPGNSVQVSALPVPNPPAKLDLRLVPGGVEISFSVELSGQSQPQPPAKYFYRILRRVDGAKSEATLVAQLAPAGSPLTVVDSRIDWETAYEYWVTPITHWESGGKSGDVEGDDSAHLKILAHDSFPPAVPAGLQAVYAGDPQKPAVDLTWTPNSDDDLAGYNVYRREGTGAFAKINSALVKSPAFHDAQVRAGDTYIYAVSAVDLRNNESEKSKETAERVPLD